MLTPELPHDELDRLRNLRALDVLDTPAEERFDRITRIARALFHAPIALVSLVDEHRQWFKSRQGLLACETPREISFCGHAILQENALWIEDARQDVRFQDNPLVTGPLGLRFYVGAPLVTRAGHALGTLCIIEGCAKEVRPRHGRTPQRSRTDRQQ
jgi:GAF domain-containing protein